MSIKQNKNGWKVAGFGFWCSVLLSCFVHVALVHADDGAINNLEFSTLAGNQVQVQLEMDGPIVEPKIFQTDNPSRIALDFAGVKSNLAKKKLSNQSRCGRHGICGRGFGADSGYYQFGRKSALRNQNRGQ